MNVSSPREMSHPEGAQGVCGCQEAQFVDVNTSFMTLGTDTKRDDGEESCRQKFFF